MATHLMDHVGRWFNASSVADGRVIPLTIEDVELGVETRTGPVACLTFRESSKKLILKDAIIRQLAADFGSDVAEEWVGRRIELYEERGRVGADPNKAMCRARAIFEEE